MRLVNVSKRVYIWVGPSLSYWNSNTNDLLTSFFSAECLERSSVVTTVIISGAIMYFLSD